MVYPIGSFNQNNYNYEQRKLIRTLQSLGVDSSGNYGLDRHLLQRAEYAKLKSTLSAQSEQNLNKLNDSGQSFYDTISASLKTNKPEYSLSSDTSTSGANQIALLNRYQLGL